MNLKKNRFGPTFEIVAMAIIASIICLFLKLLNVTGNITDVKTFETTLIEFKNIFSGEGIKYVLNNSLSNFQMLEPLILIIISLVAVSVMEASGLLKHLFIRFKDVKPKIITLFVVFVGIISTFIGDTSYALLLPLAGIFYKYIGKNSALGVLTMFVGITIGYGTGLIYDYNMSVLGDITETSAASIIPNYNYEYLSNIFLLIASTIILSVVGMIVLDRFSKKYTRNEEEDNLISSKKALKITTIVFATCMALLVYCVIRGLPCSGIFLSQTEHTYIRKLFGEGSTLGSGLIVILAAIFIVCGYVYGVVSRNIKPNGNHGKILTRSFEGTGNIFALLFFLTMLTTVLDWTNFQTIISTRIIDFVGSTQVSGLILVLLAFFTVIIISIIMPGSLAKWKLIAPVYVPLLMRANITPTFTQAIFLAGDSVGKLFSPIYVYLIVTVGFMYKYEKNCNETIFSTMKKIMPTVLLLGLTWLGIIVGWYLIGLPIGIGTSTTM